LYSWGSLPFLWGGETPHFPCSREKARQNSLSLQM
jgi:hypothetical protein